MTNENDGSRVARRARQRTRAAGAMIVPGFPEVVLREEQCRLCLLIERAPDVLHEVHSLYRQGAGVRALETQTRELWTRLGEAPIDARSFGRHFKGHVDFSEVTMAVGETLADGFDLPSLDDPPVEEVKHEPASAVKGLIDFKGMPPPAFELAKPRPEDTEAGADDYFDMENVIRRLRARMEQLDGETSFVDEDKRINSYGIVVWVRLISELRQALEALNRMKNTDRITKAVLQAHTKRHTQILSAPLINRFEGVLHALHSGDVESATIMVERLVREEVKTILVNAATETVRESCEVYKIH